MEDKELEMNFKKLKYGIQHFSKYFVQYFLTKLDFYYLVSTGCEAKSTGREDVANIFTVIPEAAGFSYLKPIKLVARISGGHSQRVKAEAILSSFGCSNIDYNLQILVCLLVDISTEFFVAFQRQIVQVHKSHFKVAIESIAEDWINKLFNGIKDKVEKLDINYSEINDENYTEYCTIITKLILKGKSKLQAKRQTLPQKGYNFKRQLNSSSNFNSSSIVTKTCILTENNILYKLISSNSKYSNKYGHRCPLKWEHNDNLIFEGGNYKRIGIGEDQVSQIVRLSQFAGAPEFSKFIQNRTVIKNSILRDLRLEVKLYGILPTTPTYYDQINVQTVLDKIKSRTCIIIGPSGCGKTELVKNIFQESQKYGLYSCMIYMDYTNLKCLYGILCELNIDYKDFEDRPKPENVLLKKMWLKLGEQYGGLERSCLIVFDNVTAQQIVGIENLECFNEAKRNIHTVFTSNDLEIEHPGVIKMVELSVEQISSFGDIYFNFQGNLKMKNGIDNFNFKDIAKDSELESINDITNGNMRKLSALFESINLKADPMNNNNNSVTLAQQLQKQLQQQLKKYVKIEKRTNGSNKFYETVIRLRLENANLSQSAMTELYYIAFLEQEQLFNILYDDIIKLDLVELQNAKFIKFLDNMNYELNTKTLETLRLFALQEGRGQEIVQLALKRFSNIDINGNIYLTTEQTATLFQITLKLWKYQEEFNSNQP